MKFDRWTVVLVIALLITVTLVSGCAKKKEAAVGEPPGSELPETGPPPVVVPPETEPPVVELPETEPPPIAGEGPETEPPPIAGEGPETEPPTVEIPETQPPATEQPGTGRPSEVAWNDKLFGTVESRGDLDEVTVFYGTDRARSARCGEIDSAVRTHRDCEPNEYYTDLAADRLELGTLKVTLPRYLHDRGELERPVEILLYRESEDPSRHVVLDSIDAGDDRGTWLGKIEDTGLDQAFVYVHGYSTSFAAAARRAGQVAYDLGFDGLPMLYSWRSTGTPEAYLADGETVKLAEEHFRDFLQLVARESGLGEVHVIAHSMGNRLVANTLRRMGREDGEGQLVSELVLAAPDVDAELFRKRFAEVLPDLARRVTLYLSSKDRALRLSQEIRLDRTRAGQLQSELLGVLSGIDTVDASAVRADFLQHSYYANNTSVLSDLHCVLAGVDVSERPLLLLEDPSRPDAWRIKSKIESDQDGSDPDTCEPGPAGPEILPPAEFPEPPETTEPPVDDRGTAGWWFLVVGIALGLAVAVWFITRRWIAGS